ncbi:hypothetical protein AWN57_07790 [Enterococcus faecium]|uniref:hypothetical protein n=1 Tax=Enterococcus faecium TaxID=1352 RepID=UPI000763B85D|nr:hypothetical protein [Enterococcus faecium]KWW77192.1 hypothetical protein AWN57_07790 [Enterococcus faecium]
MTRTDTAWHDTKRREDFHLRFGGAFPWYGSYDGIPAVLIPLEEYNRLLALSGRSTAASAQVARAADAPLRLTRWDLDPEVAHFVTEHLGKVPQKEIRGQIAERFGTHRTPTLSALNRFAVKWRRMARPR